MVSLIRRIGLLCLSAMLLLSCASTATSTGYIDDDSKSGIYPPPPANFVRKTIAIIPFSDKTNQKYTKTDLGAQAVDIGTTLLLNSDRFNVVERERLDALLAEQKLVGIVSPETAAKAGKVLGADLIFTGAITDFEVKRAKSGGQIFVPHIGKMPAFNVGKETKTLSILLAIDGRIIESETAHVVFADSAEIRREETAEGWNFGVDYAQFASGGAIKLDESAAGKQLRLALDNMIRKMILKIDAAYTPVPAQPANGAQPADVKPIPK